MDKTKENLRRIRAYDAEEEWKTIKGSHILVKNGEIVAGAGGKFNGEKFYGGSVNKEDLGTKFNYRSHPAYQKGLNHTTKSFENSYFDEEEVIATKEDSKAQLEKWQKMLEKHPNGEVSKKQVAWYRGTYQACNDILKKLHAGSNGGSKPARSSKVQAMENLASAAKPEKTDPTTSRAVITPEMKKQVEADFEMNKKKFPENEHKAVSQTLKKYFDKAETYLNKDMYNEYAAETAKARCLMKKIYGQEYATRDPAE